MPTEELLERVRALRRQGRSPKEIARALGLPRATVTPLIRTIAAESNKDAPERTIAGCWVSPGWARGLTVHGSPAWPGLDVRADSGASGLVTIVVARDLSGSRVSACRYLVDVYCLGVKDAFGPRVMDRRKLPEFVFRTFSAYDGSPMAAPVELARQLVFGAIEYARGLGFEPCSDFDARADHLGPRQGSSVISFGREGKPFFIQGPRDNARQIMRTLENSVGRDGFHFIVAT
jgi:hypothetical protein